MSEVVEANVSATVDPVASEPKVAKPRAKKAKSQDGLKSFSIVLAAGVYFCYDGDGNLIGRHKSIPVKWFSLDPKELAAKLIGDSVQDVVKDDDGVIKGNFKA